MLTSNRAPQDWYPLFPNPVVAESLLDRVINNSHQVFMNGPSYRPNKRPGRHVTRDSEGDHRVEQNQTRPRSITLPTPLLNNVIVNIVPTFSTKRLKGTRLAARAGGTATRARYAGSDQAPATELSCTNAMRAGPRR